MPAPNLVARAFTTCECRTMSEGAADGGECSRHGLRSSIAERGRVAGAIKACFASIGFGTLAAVAPALAQAPQNGDELARMMITQAESGRWPRRHASVRRRAPASLPKACLRPIWRDDNFPAIRSLTRKTIPATACGLSCWRTTARRTSGSTRSSRASCVGTCRRTPGSVMRWCAAIRRTSRPPPPPGPGRSSSPCPEAADINCRSRIAVDGLRCAQPIPSHRRPVSAPAEWAAAGT